VFASLLVACVRGSAHVCSIIGSSLARNSWIFFGNVIHVFWNLKCFYVVLWYCPTERNESGCCFELSTQRWAVVKNMDYGLGIWGKEFGKSHGEPLYHGFLGLRILPWNIFSPFVYFVGIFNPLCNSLLGEVKF
jgi:hypothetical protein